MEIWKPLQAGSCSLEWLIQRRRKRRKERGRVWHMIAIMNLISVRVQVINAEPCDLAAGKMKNVKSGFQKKSFVFTITTTQPVFPLQSNKVLSDCIYTLSICYLSLSSSLGKCAVTTHTRTPTRAHTHTQIQIQVKLFTTPTIIVLFKINLKI